MASIRDLIEIQVTDDDHKQHNQIFRPNFFSNSAREIWIIVGRPCGQQ
jgi:hypothetical protein